MEIPSRMAPTLLFDRFNKVCCTTIWLGDSGSRCSKSTAPIAYGGY